MSRRYFIEHGAWHDRKTGRHLEDIVSEVKPSERLAKLLEAVADHEQTPEEAHAELEADGVDVNAFLARVHDDERSWLIARAERAEKRSEIAISDITAVERERDEAREEAQEHFDNYQEMGEQVAQRDRRIADLEAALAKAIQAAWDGPADTVGTGCAETYGQWRKRLERECRAALAAPAQPAMRPPIISEAASAARLPLHPTVLCAAPPSPAATPKEPTP